MFKNHLDMIGRNETPSKKAKFWQSYIRSLKGSEDIRAHESPRVGRPYSYYDSMPTYRSIFDEPASANERIQSSGYRYLPVSRDTYGYSPRAIYDHHYSRSIPANYDAERAWNEHLKRMQDIERRYPSRYGLYLKDKPYTPNALVPLEYEPEDKLLADINKAHRSPSPHSTRWLRAGSEPYVPPPSYWDRGSSVAPLATSKLPSLFNRAQSLLPSSWLSKNSDFLDDSFSSKLNRSSVSECTASPSPTPVKAGRWGPRPTEVAYDSDGFPIYHRRNRFRDMLDPNPSTPISSFTRDPFWWDVEDLAPFRALSVPRSNSVARDSFLSPIRNRYVWSKHPARPLTPHRTFV